VDPDSVMALIDSLKGESSENKDKDLINYLAAQITDSQMASKDVLGLTSVLNLISNLQKPVIVHNGMLDLMFMHDKFFAPLPDDLLEYKTSTNKLFPHIYDTKHLMNTRM
jgi:poly(A)-specific ribonuclease